MTFQQQMRQGKKFRYWSQKLAAAIYRYKSISTLYSLWDGLLLENLKIPGWSELHLILLWDKYFQTELWFFPLKILNIYLWWGLLSITLIFTSLHRVSRNKHNQICSMFLFSDFFPLPITSQWFAFKQNEKSQGTHFSKTMWFLLKVSYWTNYTHGRFTRLQPPDPDKYKCWISPDISACRGRNINNFTRSA